MTNVGLIGSYQNLSEEQQEMLLILAIYGCPTMANELSNSFLYCNALSKLPAYKQKAVLKDLVHLGIIERSSNSFYSLKKDIIDDVLIEASVLDNRMFFNIFNDIVTQRRYYSFIDDVDVICRHFRYLVYTHNFKKFDEFLKRDFEKIKNIIPEKLLIYILKDKISGALACFKSYIPLFAQLYGTFILRNLSPIPELDDFHENSRKELSEALVLINLFQANSLGDEFISLYPAFLSFKKLISGEKDQICAESLHFMEIYQVEAKSKKKFSPKLEGLLYILSRITQANPDIRNLRPFVNNYVSLQKSSIWAEIALPIQGLVKILDCKGRLTDVTAYCNHPLPLVRFFAFLSLYIADNEKVKSFHSEILELRDLAQRNKYHWFVAELDYILSKIDKKHPVKSQKWIIPIISEIVIQEPWEKSLLALNHIFENKKKKPSINRRLVWEVNFNYFDIKALEQSLGKTGNWSKGKPISFKRLKETALSFSTKQDEKIIEHITKRMGYRGYEYYFDTEEAFSDLCGHPYIYKLGQPNYTVELKKEELELQVTKEGGNYVLNLPEALFNDQIEIKEESLTKYTVFAPNFDQKRIAKTLNGRQLKVPITAKPLLEEVIKKISSVITINSDFIQNNIPFVEPDSQPFVQMVPNGLGLRVKLLVKPLGKNTTCFIPGEGRTNLIELIEGEKHQTRRNFADEISLSLNIANTCDSLFVWNEGFGSLDFDEPHDCLDLLSELRNANVKVEWPEGIKLKLVKGTASFAGLNLKIRKNNNWFSYEGEVAINSDLSLSLQKLLELNKNSENRFIKLDDGRFIEMTKEFKKHLQKLNAFSVTGSDELLVHPLALSSLSDFENQAHTLSGDSHWEEQRNKIQEMHKFTPKLPETLDAELRPYQQEGFQWMAKLAHWGVGACLADDMGLGKTIQIITVLLQRATKGAALVVAPASVCGNWRNEIKKFAPTLNPVLIYDLNKGFNLADFGPFDVPIISYGLLVSRSKEVKAKKWQTLVLDEAHAIKNNTTKRYKAVTGLNAGFKIIATGTPIQNHLGELWSLFQFINPGFLGSLKDFSDKYIVATSVEDEQQKMNHLKKLITPFILRRTKRQVLDDLPEKTEIILNVDFSDDERDFYEALRLQAIDDIENPDEDDKVGKHIKILAGITKLRQACCHPKLAQKQSTLSSSKLKVFERTIDDLRKNKHRVLVFSQFTSYLKMAEDVLKNKKIAYQYLDGSTPLKKRDKSVKAFQSGEGEVFLISLKAGGLGLNLTAADYVIHMDPWWNPAIEDQASDRAHRIGQTRPVTIYRLITKGTIEEKMVKLHHNKRELADNILDGTDKGNKLSSDELLKILMEG
ncbi:DEAD/DEAH box helicase [Ancylomarina sp. 16SWW S1-10-2]|uniref:DEAD/DEAH box helicase n=1 Tax=Ancylomarina sp. 16SWW S1-10-2 TaxID=2499681 RepID=UPI0012AE6CE4|nr:DEAD/DEAH box helicase [Ancylomarina sp. 16SWW S1-10-2]MRT94228.1 DEAD/DEAH box helicase [Ancylomarina sp. 16SWW S1-10-2]